jgi:inner membrane transporter RhtA
VLEKAPPVSLVVAAAVSVQLGAAIATKLFDQAGPLGTVLLRVGFAAVVLLALNRRTLSAARGLPVRWVLLFGLTLATMNSLFYEALDRIPLGVAVTLEFVGPLAVAVAFSRRVVDVVWIGLAAAGVALLGSPTVDVDHTGLACALGAGACWAAYIVIGKRVAATWPLGASLTASMCVAAVVLLPVGLGTAAGDLADPGILAAGLGVAMLSSAIPYALELLALRRLRASTFSIVLSLEPALAALAGAILLSQKLHPVEAAAVALVVAASLGAARGAREAPPPDA